MAWPCSPSDGKRNSWLAARGEACGVVCKTSVGIYVSCICIGHLWREQSGVRRKEDRIEVCINYVQVREPGTGCVGGRVSSGVLWRFYWSTGPGGQFVLFANHRYPSFASSILCMALSNIAGLRCVLARSLSLSLSCQQRIE